MNTRLEWDVVFLPSVYEGKLPHFKCTSLDEIDQEHHAYYVGKTRAKKLINISRPLLVSDYSGKQTMTCMSRFVRADMPIFMKLGSTTLLSDYEPDEDSTTE